MSILSKLPWRKQASHVSRADAQFMDDIQESLLTQSTPGSKIVLYLILVILIGALVWAKLANVEEITRGEGTVVARSGDQIIQSLEGGILEELNVREGDTVKKGQLLAKIDPTRAETSYREAWVKAIGLKATIARLRAEAYDTPLTFPDDVQKDGKEQIEQETKAYNARKKALSEAVAALNKSYDLQMQEITMSEPLVEKGLLSEVELLRMRRQATDVKAQIVDQQNRFKADANAELVRDELELSQTKENVVGRGLIDVGFGGEVFGVDLLHLRRAIGSEMNGFDQRLLQAGFGDAADGGFVVRAVVEHLRQQAGAFVFQVAGGCAAEAARIRNAEVQFGRCRRGYLRGRGNGSRHLSGQQQSFVFRGVLREVGQALRGAFRRQSRLLVLQRGDGQFPFGRSDRFRRQVLFGSIFRLREVRRQ
jgi:hypothetical protein